MGQTNNVPTIVTEKAKNTENDDDEDHIDWASSDEEEPDLEKEIASFERNQVSQWLTYFRF